MITLRYKAYALLLVVFTSLVLTTGAAFAKEQGGTRPGWGHGDKNHEHVGPPGQSVRVNASTSVNLNFGVGTKIKNLVIYVINIFN